jgi:hypothetical protein
MKLCYIVRAGVAVVTRTSGQVLRSKGQNIVLNFFNYVRSRSPENSIVWIASEAVAATGISKASVF